MHRPGCAAPVAAACQTVGCKRKLARRMASEAHRLPVGGQTALPPAVQHLVLDTSGHTFRLVSCRVSLCHCCGHGPICHRHRDLRLHHLPSQPVRRHGVAALLWRGGPVRCNGLGPLPGAWASAERLVQPHLSCSHHPCVLQSHASLCMSTDSGPPQDACATGLWNCTNICLHNIPPLLFKAGSRGCYVQTCAKVLL